MLVFSEVFGTFGSKQEQQEDSSADELELNSAHDRERCCVCTCLLARVRAPPPFEEAQHTVNKELYIRIHTHTQTTHDPESRRRAEHAGKFPFAQTHSLALAQQQERELSFRVFFRIKLYVRTITQKRNVCATHKCCISAAKHTPLCPARQACARALTHSSGGGRKQHRSRQRWTSSSSDSQHTTPTT